MSEPAIQVRRKGKGTQVWTIEKLENKLVDMREHYSDWRENTQEVVSHIRVFEFYFRGHSGDPKAASQVCLYLHRFNYCNPCSNIPFSCSISVLMYI